MENAPASIERLLFGARLTMASASGDSGGASGFGATAAVQALGAKLDASCKSRKTVLNLRVYATGGRDGWPSVRP